ncbi:Jacalin-like lectin domain [Phytophthora infestans]|uniref:Jacalin-like lectin domain n=1 Tax=Phytophthora infestans TaxID=4787 RepID=A0A8S9UN15_PHYIN|nr:Jacalin-like lectin domain [Phytophthora infestans]
MTFSHGGAGGKENTLTLAEGEYITSMEAHWAEKKSRTRIFYLSFGTSAGSTVSAGSQTESKSTVTAPEGFQLGGFFGQDGDEIDKLGTICTRISAEAPPAAAPANSAFAAVDSSGSLSLIEKKKGETTAEV